MQWERDIKIVVSLTLPTLDTKENSLRSEGNNAIGVIALLVSFGQIHLNEV